MRSSRLIRCLTFVLCALRSGLGDCNSLQFSGPENLGAIDSEDITEASGLAASWRNPGVFWTHNDGSGEKIFALSADGRLLATFKLGKSVDDVEDIAVGPGPDAQLSYLYVGDVGSNTGNRDEVKVLRTAEPQVASEPSTDTVDFGKVESFRLEYPEGKFDAEAILVDPIARDLYVVTKETSGAHLFLAHLDDLQAGETITLEAVAELEFSKVAGGAISRDGQLIALRREDAAYLWTRSPGQTIVEALSSTASALPIVGPPDEPNGEAITFLLDSSGYITLSEGEEQPLFAFRRATGTEAPQFVAAPRLTAEGIQIQVMGCAGSSLRLERSSDLQHWTPAFTITANGSVQTLLDADTSTRRYYRLAL
ncbi:MAG TPA: hypothetical protein VK633_09485 [Verrucomicrobiae bacterium]|nr:hypothetical protein [Verrucomicrobiae bacterium]